MATGSNNTDFSGTAGTGAPSLRTEVIDKVLKGFAPRKYKFKQAVTISGTNAWKNTFFRADPDVLDSVTGNAVEGIPRGSNFPQMSVTFQEINAWVKKYGAEDTIFWEDILSNDVDIMKRTIFKLTEKVIKTVDDRIYTCLSDGGTPADIQSVSVGAADYWDGSSAAIIDDLMYAKQLIGEANYDTSGLMCFINEKTHRAVVNYLAEKGAQFPSVGNDMARNGRIGKVAGVSFVVSNSVPSSQALVVVPKTCGTWKQSVSLRSDTETEAFKGTRVRIVEMGVPQLTDPDAVCLIEHIFLGA